MRAATATARALLQRVISRLVLRWRRLRVPAYRRTYAMFVCRTSQTHTVMYWPPVDEWTCWSCGERTSPFQRAEDHRRVPDAAQWYYSAKPVDDRTAFAPTHRMLCPLCAQVQGVLGNVRLCD